MRRFTPTVFIACAALALGACNSNETESRPPPLGNCVPTGDAACSVPVNGAGGGSGGEGGPGTAADGAASADGAGACGQADSLVTTSNQQCDPCIVDHCCMVDQACSASAACMGLLQCVEQSCPTGDPACIAGCESTYPGGVTPYDDFAFCLQSVCSPQCPTLPTQTSGDF